MYKTGGGEVDEDAYLTQIEESMLDFVGVEGVVGKYIYIYTGIYRYIYININMTMYGRNVS